MVSILWSLKNTVWAYYTDDRGIRREHNETNVRMILWEDPHVAFGSLDRASDLQEPAFSPNGATALFTRTHPDGGHTDLYAAQWDGRVWSGSNALVSVNGPANERGAAVSQDGQHLYFASDREGGRGGYDIWVACWTGTEWGGVTNPGAAINSPADETGPALASDGTRLFFASDRSQDSGFDIYSARLVPAPPATNAIEEAGMEGGKNEKAEKKGKKRARKSVVPAKDAEPYRAAPYPTFGQSAPVDALNSEADDRDPAVTVHGDFIYFASQREGGLGGFDLYAARMLNGEILEPGNLGMELNSEADELAPALRAEGFDLLFCSNRSREDAQEYQIYSATTREVISALDLSRWRMLKELFNRIKWWILAAVLALLLLIYLLRHWRDLTSLFHKCLVASIIFHLILLFFMALWEIAQVLTESVEPQTMEVAIDVDALAKEKLALEMQEQVTEMQESPVNVVEEQNRERVPMPEFTPRRVEDAPPIVTRSSDKSFVTRVTPSRAREAAADAAAETPGEAMPEMTLPELDLPEIEMPELDVVLDEPDPADEPEKAAEKKEFEPKIVQEDITVKKQEFSDAPSKPVQKQTSSSDALSEVTTNVAHAAAATEDTGGDLVVATAGMEALGQLPEMKGEGDEVGLLVKSLGSAEAFLIDAPGELDVPSGAGATISPQVLKNPGKMSVEVIEGLGGSAETQGAIARALVWFSKVQEPDGRWDVKKHGGESRDMAGTSLALLCYYGWGAKHNEKGPYQGTVHRAIGWMLDKQKEDGDLRIPGADMYDHGMGAIALCEAYNVSKDEKLKVPARKAIDFIIKAQDPKTGGWRYQPRQASDTSVFGWQYMALASAQLAGLDVPEKVFKDADRWLDTVGGGKLGGLYGYQSKGGNRRAMIPTGMFCRQLAKVPPTDPRMHEGAAYLNMQPMDEKSPDYYYVYYATLALYQHQGAIWQEWNERMKEILDLLQVKSGNSEGSWDPSNRGGHGNRMGRVITTAFSTLSLEVYYRILPIYGFRAVDEE